MGLPNSTSVRWRGAGQESGREMHLQSGSSVEAMDGCSDGVCVGGEARKSRENPSMGWLV